MQLFWNIFFFSHSEQRSSWIGGERANLFSVYDIIWEFKKPAAAMGPKKKRLWAPAIKIVNALKAVQSYLPASTEKNSNMFFALF